MRTTLIIAACASLAVVAPSCIGDDPATSPGPALDGGGSDVGTAPGDDGGSDASLGPDADTETDADAAPRCDSAKPFQDVTLVTNVNSNAYESGATLTADELTIIFSSGRTGQNDIYQAIRSHRSDDFSAPFPLVDVNANGGDDQSPTLTIDGKTLYLRSNRTGTTGFNDVFVGTRGSAGAKFGGFDPAQNINTAGDDIDPKINGAGTRLTYSSDAAGGGGGGYDLWEAPVNGGVVGPGKPLTELNTPGWEGNAVLTDDDLTVYFHSNRTAPAGGKGSLDIWVARRSTLTAPFEKLENVAEINSAAEDVPLWISPDGCVIYFASSRPGIGARDLYSATRGR